MLAPRQIPTDYVRWNQAWNSPFGRECRLPRFLLSSRRYLRTRGPFAWQPNNSTREYEYPWAYHKIAETGERLRILEIGGGLSGLQFVLAGEGHQVTNVDPGIEPAGVRWNMSQEFHGRLCRAFDAPVQLIPASISEAHLPDRSFDLVLTISVIEHFPECEIESLSRHLTRILKPGGRVVMTVDLFLDQSPFCSRDRNKFGTNINIRELLDRCSLDLAEGDRSQLVGFDEFNADSIHAHLSEFLIGSYPALAQCLVATLR